MKTVIVKEYHLLVDYEVRIFRECVNMAIAPYLFRGIVDEKEIALVNRMDNEMFFTEKDRSETLFFISKMRALIVNRQSKLPEGFSDSLIIVHLMDNYKAQIKCLDEMVTILTTEREGMTAREEKDLFKENKKR